MRGIELIEEAELLSRKAEEEAEMINAARRGQDLDDDLFADTAVTTKIDLVGSSVPVLTAVATSLN